MKNNLSKKNGFTIIELIIAGAISVTAIGVGFTLPCVRVTSKEKTLKLKNIKKVIKKTFFISSLS